MCVCVLGGGGSLSASSQKPTAPQPEVVANWQPRVTSPPHTSGLRRKGDSEKQGVRIGSEVWPNLGCRRALAPTVPWPVSSRTLVAPA